MFGRVLRFLFALPVALAATAGLYYFGFVQFLDRDADLGNAPIPVAEEPFNFEIRTDGGWGPPLCLDCSGPPPKKPETILRYDPPCDPCGDSWTFPEPVDGTIDAPDDAFSVTSIPGFGKREAFVPSPRFPKTCIDKGASGAVSVEFDITPEGAVTNARIIVSADECFNAEVLRYVSKFRFQPQTDEAGRPTWRRGVRQTFTFELDE